MSLFGKLISDLENFVKEEVDDSGFDDNALVFATYNESYFNNETLIQAWYDYEVRTIAKRQGEINTLCLYNDVLYDGGEHGVFRTVSGERISFRNTNALCSHENVLYCASGRKVYETLTDKVVAERECNIFSLLSTDIGLFDCGGLSNTFGFIYETLTNKLVVKRHDCVLSLGFFNGELYEGCSNGRIYQTFNTSFIKNLFKIRGKCIAKRIYRNTDSSLSYALLLIHSITSFCVYNGRLYDGGGSFSGYVFDTLRNVPVARRSKRINALCVHDGFLYDGGGSGLFRTSTGFQISNKPIISMVSVPLNVLDEFF